MSSKNPQQDRERRVFGASVSPAAFSRYRPGYPDAVVDWMLRDPRDRLTVLDVGAGTGKLTETVVRRGHEAIALDPSEEMLRQLARYLPDVRREVGEAESIPLEDASVDAVVVGQAWHWFDAARASAEFARVLRPGGVVGVVWNVRDEHEPWVADLNRAVGRGPMTTTVMSQPPELTGPFGAVEHQMVENTHALPNAAAVVALAQTWSYVNLAGHAQQALNSVLELAEGVAASDGTVVIPQNCAVYRIPRD